MEVCGDEGGIDQAIRDAQPVRVIKRDRVVSRVRIQIDAARQPDGILGEQDPLSALSAFPVHACPCRVCTL